MSFFKNLPDLNATFQTLSQSVHDGLQGSALQNLTQTVQDGFQGSLKEAQTLAGELQPFAARTTRLLQERFGQAEDVSELPAEYLELERKVDVLRVVYRNLLNVTETYEFQSYDYPPNVKESFSDVSKSLTGKFYDLSKTSTTKEAEALLNAQATTKVLPKTLAHALSRAASNSRKELMVAAYHAENEEVEETEINPLADALLKLADTQKHVGEKRLEQDQMIINEFNNKLNQILTDSFQQTSQNRKKVEKARLDFDTLRTQIKKAEEAEKLAMASRKSNTETNAAPDGAEGADSTAKNGSEVVAEGQSDLAAAVPSTSQADELTTKLEVAEDELVNATEEAVASMKRILDPAESVSLLQVLVRAQLEYFKGVTADLEVLSGELDAIVVTAAEEE